MGNFKLFFCGRGYGDGIFRFGWKFEIYRKDDFLRNFFGMMGFGEYGFIVLGLVS